MVWSRLLTVTSPYIGVACACVSNRHSRSCSVYDICKRRCLATKDRSGACLPILCESDEERWWEATNVEAKRHVDAVRAKRSKNTCQIDRRYRCLMRQITLHLSELVEAEVLKYYQLKRWVYMVRPDLRMKTKEKHPSVEEMLNGFYRHWFDTNDLKKLIEKIKESTTEPLTFIGELESFEREVDLYFSNRMSLHGNGSNGEFKALLCLDPEWSHYPAHELYKLQERACEALERTRRCNFTVYFCTVLKEYVLLTHVEIFIQDLKEAVAKGVNSKDDDLAIPLSIEAAHCESSSALVTGIKPGLVPDTQSVGCSCSQLSHAARAERVPLPAYVKHFIFPRSP